MGFFTRVKKINQSPLWMPFNPIADEAAQVAGPSPICHSHCSSPAAPAACWQKGLCGHLPTIPGKTSQVSQHWLFQLAGLFGSFLLRWVWMRLQQQAISSAVAEAAHKSAKRGLQGAGAAWRHHLLIRPQSTREGCSDARWVAPGELSSN